MKEDLEDFFSGQDEAATPLEAEEIEALIPSYITLRRELNEAEQANILKAEDWAFRRRRTVLREAFLQDLHRRMFGRVWRWAGRYRTTNKNIGVDAWQIPQALGQVIDQCRYWVDHKTFPADTTAAHFHHKLVQVHLFPNGNGRHARLASDLFLVCLGRERFTWGSVNLVDDGETRHTYITALRAADNHDIEPLLAFVRS